MGAQCNFAMDSASASVDAAFDAAHLRGDIVLCSAYFLYAINCLIRFSLSLFQSATYFVIFFVFAARALILESLVGRRHKSNIANKASRLRCPIVLDPLL